MRKITNVFIIAVMLTASAFTTIYFTDWKIEDGYSIKFSGGGNNGVFKTLAGDITFDENDLAASKFNVTVDVTSINTGNGIKNNHAKSDKWFNAKEYPYIKFTSASVVKANDKYQVSGRLEMHGVQKQITIPFTFADNTFSGSFKVNRFDYQIGSDNSGPGSYTDGEMKIDISVPVKKI